MSSILTRSGGESRTESIEDVAGDPVIQAFRMAMEDTDERGSTSSQDGGIARTFLLIDLGAAMRYLRGRRGSSEATKALTEMAPESESDGGSQGRGVLQRLFLLGIAVGVAYALRRRGVSANEAVGAVTERARSVADETAMRSGEAAGRAETVTQEAADRIEESGEMAAERIQEGSETAAEQVETGGEAAADQFEEAGETVENVEEKAEERADEMTGTDEGTESGQESQESGS